MLSSVTCPIPTLRNGPSPGSAKGGSGSDLRISDLARSAENAPETGLAGRKSIGTVANRPIFAASLVPRQCQVRTCGFSGGRKIMCKVELSSSTRGRFNLNKFVHKTIIVCQQSHFNMLDFILQ